MFCEYAKISDRMSPFLQFHIFAKSISWDFSLISM